MIPRQPSALLRLVGYDLGIHLGCVCLDVTEQLAVSLVARATIHVGTVVALPEPILHTRQNGTTWTQRTERVIGPGVMAQATAEAVAWALSLGADAAAIEWIAHLNDGSRTPVLHAGQVGQSLYEGLGRAGVPTTEYARSTALALVRRLAVERGAPVLPGVVKSRGAELTPVLGAMVAGWAGSGPAVGRHVGAATKGNDDERIADAGEARVGRQDLGGQDRGRVGDHGDPRGGDHDGADVDVQRVAGVRHVGGDARDPAVPQGRQGDQVLARVPREDRRPEHETDACAVALAHVAHLAGVTIHGRKRAPTTTTAAPRTKAAAALRRLPAAECKACLRSAPDGPAHRRECIRWCRVAGFPRPRRIAHVAVDSR